MPDVDPQVQLLTAQLAFEKEKTADLAARVAELGIELKGKCDCKVPWWRDLKGFCLGASAISGVIAAAIGAINHSGIQQVNDRPHAATPEQVDEAVKKGVGEVKTEVKKTAGGDK